MPTSHGTKTRDEFMADLKLLGFEFEHVFHPDRKWRLDAARPDLKVGVEYDGFVGANQGHGNVGHTSIAGMMRDQEKLNEAAILGWIVIRVNAKTCKSKDAMNHVIRALEARGAQIG